MIRWSDKALLDFNNFGKVSVTARPVLPVAPTIRIEGVMVEVKRRYCSKKMLCSTTAGESCGAKPILV